MMPTMDEATSLERATHWRLAAWGRERHVPAEGYWFENRERGDGSVVFQVTIAGSMMLRDGKVVQDVPPGHAALFLHDDDSAYGMPHGSTAAYTCEWLSLNGSGLREHWNALRARFGSVVAVDDQVLADARRLCKQADPRRGAEPIAMAGAVHSFVLGLFVSLRRDHQAAQSPVERALDDLFANPLGAPPLKRLAERHGCSREHLARTFTERMGMPPAAWLADQRLERAISLLRDTGLPIAAIATQCGFGSTHTLARQVRATTGAGPQALRRR